MTASHASAEPPAPRHDPTPSSRSRPTARDPATARPARPAHTLRSTSASCRGAADSVSTGSSEDALATRNRGSVRGDAVGEYQEYHYAGRAGCRGLSRRVGGHPGLPLWQNHAMEMIDRAAPEIAERADTDARDRHAVAAWLFICCALLFAAIPGFYIGIYSRTRFSGEPVRRDRFVRNET